MLRPTLQRAWLLPFLVSLTCAFAQSTGPLPGTRLLEMKGDLSREMVSGIHRFAMRELERSIPARATLWARDLSSPEAYENSVRLNRDYFRRIIGAVDERVPMTGMELVTTTSASAQIAETETYTVSVVRWPVFEGVHGEGLLLQPKGTVRARIVVIPDADQTPEMLAGLAASFSAVLPSPCARQLAENGSQVLIPVLIDRRDEWSGNARLNRFTNQPHREWIYRQAYEMGRHIIGYEVQKVLAAVDWFTQENKSGADVPIGVAGYAEGALIAFYAAALDQRIDATLVSGYFDSRQKIWEEPIYRNVFGLLEQFGDAEIASMITPRALVIEHCAAPAIYGPPQARRGRGASAAPGVITTPSIKSVEAEFNRAKSLCGETFSRALQLCVEQDDALNAFWTGLRGNGSRLASPRKAPVPAKGEFDIDGRQRRQVRELEAHTQKLLQRSEEIREKSFWEETKAGLTRELARQHKSIQDNLLE